MLRNCLLRNRHDLRSVTYLLVQPLLAAALWLSAEHGQQWGLHTTLHWALYCVLLYLSVAVGVIHHHHAHLRMWNNKVCNRLTDYWITLLQGHPTYVFYATHNANHHRYHHGPLDVARTYRFRGGDTNNLVGYLLHPFQATWVLYPVFMRWLARMRRRAPGVFGYCVGQYAALGLLWVFLVMVNADKFVVYVLLPQLFGLHWLLATNYLQHAHADGHSPLNFARNFTGGMNTLFFNIGLHTAHHLHPRVHWSHMPALHQQLATQIDSRLNAGPLLPYMVRTFVISLFVPAARSTSLMARQAPKQSLHNQNLLHK